jgi:hypothetical protein
MYLCSRFTEFVLKFNIMPPTSLIIPQDDIKFN